MVTHAQETAAADSASRVQKIAVRILPLLLWLGAALCAFLAASAPVFGGLHPFGVALAASVSAPYALCSAAGALIGYALCLPMDAAVPYIAAVVAVALIRALAAPHRQKVSPYAPAAAGALCGAVTGIGMVFVSGGGAVAMLLAVAEGFLVLGAAYFFIAALSLQNKSRKSGTMDAETRGTLLFVFAAVLCCAAPYTVAGINLALLTGAFLTLCGALLLQEDGAALLGITACMALIAASPSLLFAGLGIAAGALAAGFVRTSHRALTALLFCGGSFAGVLLAPDTAAGFHWMASACCAAILVCLLPQKWLHKAALPARHTPLSRATLQTLSARLETFSGALSSIGATLNAVCDRLPQTSETYADVCDGVTETVCKRCPRCAQCWGSGSNAVYDAFNNLQTILTRTGGVTAEALPAPLQSECLYATRLAAAFNKLYYASMARRAACAKNTAMRTALAEQYGALAAALGGLSAQVYREQSPDVRKTARIVQLFRKIGTEPLEVQVSTDADERLYVDVCLPRMTFTAEEMALLTKEVAALCRCAMEQVACQQTPLTTRLMLRQAAQFTPLFGVCSLPASGTVSADAVKMFADVSGAAHLLLCDGMGTGKAAAIDGNLSATLSAQLLEAGFAAAEAARLVNIALTLKGRGEAEAGATVDALSVNLFTGAAELFKAGAVASYLVRRGVVTMLGGESLPIGILNRVTGCTDRLQLQQDDMLVLVSDGATAADPDWIFAELSLAQADAPQALADNLAKAAQTRTKRPDDITVACMRLARAV
ncbi:MAG: SpoIIE family protein phosphatase [Ruthenibacterium sp.]